MKPNKKISLTEPEKINLFISISTMNEILMDTIKPPAEYSPRLVVMVTLCDANRSGKRHMRISKIISSYPKIVGIKNCIGQMIEDGLIKNAGKGYVALNKANNKALEFISACDKVAAAVKEVFQLDVH